jgi:hypothetical protein
MTANTSGTNVAQLRNLTKAQWQELADEFGALSAQAEAVANGAAVPLTLDFVLKSASDRLPDETMREIIRRLVVTLEIFGNNPIVLSTVAPQDITKVWWPADPVTNTPIGVPKTWDAATQAWIPIIEPSTPSVVFPKTRFTAAFADSGESDVTFSFKDIGTSDFFVSLTPLFYSNGDWTTPAGFTHYGWALTNKSTNFFTAHFFGVPTGGMTFEAKIEEKIEKD